MPLLSQGWKPETELGLLSLEKSCFPPELTLDNMLESQEDQGRVDLGFLGAETAGGMGVAVAVIPVPGDGAVDLGKPMAHAGTCS